MARQAARGPRGTGDPSDDRPTVSAQQDDPSSLLNEVKKLISVRRSFPALQNTAEIEFISDGSEGSPLAYIRCTLSQAVLVMINPTRSAAEVDAGSSSGKVIYSVGRGAEVHGYTSTIEAQSAAFVLL